MLRLAFRSQLHRLNTVGVSNTAAQSHQQALGCFQTAPIVFKINAVTALVNAHDFAAAVRVYDG